MENKEKGEAKKKAIDEVIPVAPRPPKVKKQTVANKEMTAINFSEMIGLSKSGKFWVRKRFDQTETRKASVWSDEFIKHGAISTPPSILSQIIS